MGTSIKDRLGSLSWRDWAVFTGGTILLGESIKYIAREVGKDLLFGTIADAIRPWLVKMIGEAAGSMIAASIAPYLLSIATIAFVAWWFGRNRNKAPSSEAESSQSDSTTTALLHTAIGFRDEIVAGRLKAAEARWQRQAFPGMLQLMNSERVHSPRLMEAGPDGLTPKQIQMLGRYQDRERELDRWIDDCIAGKYQDVHAARGFRHRLGKLSKALDRLIESLENG